MHDYIQKYSWVIRLFRITRFGVATPSAFQESGQPSYASSVLLWTPCKLKGFGCFEIPGSSCVQECDGLRSAGETVCLRGFVRL
jgi:hypothetical protein